MANNRLALLEAKIIQRVEGALVIAGELVATEARRSVQKSGRSGRVYKKTNPKRTHKASAPGEAPATDLGFLARSIQVEPETQNLRVKILSIHSIAPYARALEYGDMSRNLYPRPFMRPALKQMRTKAEKVVHDAVKKAIRESNSQ